MWAQRMRFSETASDDTKAYRPRASPKTKLPFGGSTCLRSLCSRGLHDKARLKPEISSSARASCKSFVSKPSVNQSYTSASSLRASACLPCRMRKRPKLITARNSKSLVPCWRAVSMALKKHASASGSARRLGTPESRLWGRNLPLQSKQLRVAPALPGAARGGERLSEHGEPLLRPSSFPQRLSQQPKLIRQKETAP